MCVCVCVCTCRVFGVRPLPSPITPAILLGRGWLGGLLSPSGAMGWRKLGRGRPWRPSLCPSSKGRQPLIDLWLRRQTTCLRQCRHSFCHTAVLSVAVVAHFTISLSARLPRKEDLSLTGPAPAQTILFLTPQRGVRHHVGAVLAPVRSSLAGDSKGSSSLAGWEYAKD